MHNEGGYQYAVVQFLELPYSNIDDYVCVPHSWIRTRRAKDRKTTVAFPDEPERLTKKRIVKCEKPLETWNVYMAIIKYETYSYNVANLYILEKKADESTLNEIADHTSLPNTSTDNINVSVKRTKRPETQSTKLQSKAKVSDQCREISEFPGHANLEPETPPSQILKNMNETQVSSFRTGTQNPRRDIFYTPRNVTILKNEILRYPEIHEDLSFSLRDCSQKGLVEGKRKRNIFNQQARVPEISIPPNPVQDFVASTSFIKQNQTNVNQSHQTQKFVYQDHPQATQKTPRRLSEMEITEETDTEDSFADGNFVKEADQPVGSITNVRNGYQNLADIFDKMDCDISQTCEVTFELHQSFVRSATAIKRIKNLYEKFQNDRVNNANVKTTEDVTVDDNETTVADKDLGNQAEMENDERPDEDMNDDEGKGRNEKAKNSEDENDDDGDNSNDNDSSDESSKKNEDDEKKKAPNKNRGLIRTFVLPEEYDPNDTKWTLKHRKYDKKLGLVELLPKTKVYINSIRLAHCKRVAKDTKTLARMLLLEIFNRNALSVCSLTGARANAFDNNGKMKVRPGLDEHARMVIMNFVEEHSRQKNWGVFDSQSVINSVRSKIQEMRAKYGKTE